MLTGVTMPSPQGLAFIKRYQGLSLARYQDADGLWLIGYGHLIAHDEVFEAPIAPSQAEALFLQDVGRYQQVLHQCVHIPLTQSQYDALLSLAFSLGTQALPRSPIIQAINQRAFAEALDEWRSEGERQNGLAIQRQAEMALFQNDVR